MLTGPDARATGARVRRLKALVALMLLVPLVGSEVTWALALEVLADSSHHVSLRTTRGRLDIVLQHGTDTDRHDRHLANDVSQGPGTALTPRAHDHHADHVVALAASERLFAASTKQSPSNDASLILLAAPIGCASVRAEIVSCVARSRVGPAAPSRSRILRI